MKLHTMKRTVPFASMLALAAYGNMATAHTQGGSLGAAAASTDYYTVTCSNDGSGAPLSLQVQVADSSANASRVSTLVQKGNFARNSTDAVDTDGAAGYSPFVWVNGGSGVYNVFLSHSAAVADNYSLQFHCMTGNNGTGVHTGTGIATKQNQ